MKALEFIYQESEIHFLMNPTDDNVMVNATEMAKIFGKRTNVFLKSDHAKAFIDILEQTPNGVHSDKKIIDRRGHSGIYFHRILALKFAAWLNPEFEVWVFQTIEKIKFGHYKDHWDAHVWQEKQQAVKNKLASEMLTNPTPEKFKEYLKTEENIQKAKNKKRRAIYSQYNLFNEHHS